MSQPPQSIFISCVRAEFEAERDDLALNLRMGDRQVRFQPEMPADGQLTVEDLDERIRRCDAVVHLLGHRAGHRPAPDSVDRLLKWRGQDFLNTLPSLREAVLHDPYRIAYTQWEAYLALDHDLPLYIFAPSDRAGAPDAEQAEHEERLGRIDKYPKKVDFANRLNESVLTALLAGSDRSHQAERLRTYRRFDRTAYCKWIQSAYLRPELGLLPRPAGTTAPKLSEVYVPAITHAPSDHSDAQAIRGSEQEDPTLVMDRLADESLFLTAEAGAGKSTFTRWLALSLAAGEVPAATVEPDDERYRERLPASLAGKVPVLVPLRDLLAEPAKRDELLGHLSTPAADRLEHTLGAWLGDENRAPGTDEGRLTGPVWEALLREGECVVILDGLDEFPAHIDGGQKRPRKALVDALNAVLPAWHEAGNRVLLTSRPYGLDAVDTSLEMPKTELLALPETLQRLLVRRWFVYRHAESSTAQTRASGLLSELAARAAPDRDRMAERPLLLTALCALYDAGQDGGGAQPGLPVSEHALYDKLVDQVLFNRFGDKDFRRPLRRALARIARRMHTATANEPAFEASDDDLEELLRSAELPDDQMRRCFESPPLDAAGLVDRLKSHSGLLQPAGPHRAEFVIPRIQEFLAAEAIEREHDGQQTPAHWFQAHASTREWHATLRLLLEAIARKRSGSTQKHSVHACLATLQKPDGRIDERAANADTAPLELFIEGLLTASAAGISGLEERFYKPLHAAADRALKSVDAPPHRRRLRSPLAVFRRAARRREPIRPAVRALLWRGLGELGIDNRPGVGLGDDGLPDIAWCDVAGGQVDVEDLGTCDVAAFRISRHPITHAQFQAFVEADDGYGNEACWKPEWLEHGRIDRSDPPRAKWPISNHPREHVNWYEAMAFCRWLDARLRARGELGDAEQLRLPFEWEWQQAASWDPDRGRHYEWPWGDEWDAGKANTSEGERLGRTTPVGIYPDGGAPCGALDMAGNVLEWCLNEPAEEMPEGASGRALRGGSWIFLRHYGRAAFRYGDLPLGRFDDFGFRVCVASPILGH